MNTPTCPFCSVVMQSIDLGMPLAHCWECRPCQTLVLTKEKGVDGVLTLELKRPLGVRATGRQAVTVQKLT